MTKTLLTHKSFESSRHFLEAQARPLETALFRHFFDGASITPVLEALTTYQNPDGGFGHALEPDLRAPESSALCTSIAFQILRSIHASPSESLVKSGVAYLLTTLNRQTGHWQIISSTAGQSPHAPWWDTTNREQEFASFSLNPTAELLGYLYDYIDDSHREILLPLTERVLSYLAGQDKIVMHDLLCCLRLLRTESLPLEIRQPLGQKLAQLIDGVLTYDPSQWKDYGLRPLQVIDDPGSMFMPGREGAVETNLDYEISTQNEDGSWSPNWTWGDLFPGVWPTACREWSGVITLDKLLILKRFHRIEGIG